ncbi:MAG: PD40 domain-containing protein [Proteobacteria bacterium]|nr:PD40 domain-containing protein [Pseudomonadota bacterium]
MEEDIDYAVKELRMLEVLYIHDKVERTTSYAGSAQIADYIKAKRATLLVSADGRYEVFQSNASNLVEADENRATDIFLRDNFSDTLSRASVSSKGEESNGYSLDASISPEGRYVVFESDATNLVEEDTNNVWDIFLYDTLFHTTTRVSLGSGGTQSSGGNSTAPSVSADGRYVAFDSEAVNLVEGDTNMLCDIFVHDRFSGTTRRVSVNLNGAESFGGDSFSPTISSDGRFVTFYSLARNLVGE